MAHLHNVIDTEAHFVIDPVARVVKNKSTTPKVLIQYDHGSERITFEVPRFIDSHDVMECNVIEIHYKNVEKGKARHSKGYYIVTDQSVSGEVEDIVEFTWLIEQPATLYVGDLDFSIRFACVNDLEINYQWFTGVCKELSIKEGIYNVDIPDDPTNGVGTTNHITLTDIASGIPYKLYVMDEKLTMDQVSNSGV